MQSKHLRHWGLGSHEVPSFWVGLAAEQFGHSPSAPQRQTIRVHTEHPRRGAGRSAPTTLVDLVTCADATPKKAHADEEEFKQYSATGGTSLSSPLIASLYALAGGGGGVGYPAATLYGHLGQAPSLYDVTERGNGYCAGPAGVTVRDRRQTIR